MKTLPEGVLDTTSVRSGMSSSSSPRSESSSFVNFKDLFETVISKSQHEDVEMNQWKFRNTLAMVIVAQSFCSAALYF